MREINLIDVFRKVLSRLINNIINLALTFSDSHSTMFPTFTLIFALVSKSVYRISKFALIKKLGKNLNFSSSAILDSAILDLAILGSPMVTIQAVVAMVTVPVAMVTGLVAMEYRAFCVK